MANKVPKTGVSAVFGHAGSSFLERNHVPMRGVLSYLDAQGICRVACCSSNLEQQASAPRLWELVSQTLGLPDDLLGDRSKNSVRVNLHNIKSANAVFVQLCRQDNPKGPDGETPRQKIVKFAKLQDSDFDARLPLGNHLDCFRNHVRPIVQAMCKTEVPSAALHELLMYDGTRAAQILALSYTCGHRGAPETLNYITGYPLYCPKIREGVEIYGVVGMAKMFRDTWFKQPLFIYSHKNLGMMTEIARASDAKLSMPALELLLKYGELPKTFAPLLAEYDVRPTPRLAQIIAYLIDRGSTPPNLVLFQFLQFGPLEYVKFFIEKTKIEVKPTHLSCFLYMLSHAIIIGTIPQKCASRFGWNAVMNIIDLMHAKQPDVRDFQEQNEHFSNNFGCLACVGAPRAVLEKLIAVGIRPLNDPNPDARSNSIALAMAAKLPYERIALMVSLGATPPSNYKEMIQQQYSDQPQVQEQLLKLFA